MIRRHPYIFLTLSILLLALLCLVTGAADISFNQVLSIITGDEKSNPIQRYIILQSRLPQTITALLSGASLAACGLMLQTAFRNPLAGPSIFGISSGASLGVALVMLLFGGTLTAGAMTLTGTAAIILGATIGAMAITLLLVVIAQWVTSATMLLIVGIMVGYLSSSLVTLLNYAATDEGVKSYVVWGMGDFSGITLNMLPLYSILCLLLLAVSLLFIKPLNALLLGRQYAESVGINTLRARNGLLIVTSLLTATVTAFCGPIAFIGLAVPHMARMLLHSDNQNRLLPVSMLTGGVVALFCNWICSLPFSGGSVPLNAVTPLIGAPVIIYVIIHHR
ncbi:MAG: iron chelate uptake ABC transporter family permease subunit [Prevotella sp.]|jgi:iron complex transport system permease protein